MARLLQTFRVLWLVVASIMIVGCSNNFALDSGTLNGQDSDDDDNTPPSVAPLTIDPTAVSMTINTTRFFVAAGGTPPYTYSVSSGVGTMTDTANGQYSADAAPGFAVVRVTDADGSFVNSSVTVTAVGVGDHFELISGDAQTGTVASNLAANPVVRVVDNTGLPVFGYEVNFSASGDGAVGTATAFTDVAGNATPISWTLATTAGANSLTVTGNPALPDFAGSGNPTLVLSATGVHDVADHLVLVQGDAQTATVNSNVATEPQVRVVDQYGNQVEDGYSISFTPSGTGAVGASPDTSDATGIAGPTTWTLSQTSGANTLVAAGVPGLPDLAGSGNATITFNATGDPDNPDHLELVQGDSQTATVNANVTTEPQVRVVDRYGNPITAGYSITFTPSGDGAVGASPDTSDGSGIAGPTTWTMATTAGANTLIAAGSPALPDAAASGNASITFNATGTAAAADHLELVQGDSQSADAGRAVAIEPQVRVVDEFGNPVTTGYSITFTPSGTGVAGTSPDTSDGSGIAGPTTWTLSQTAGANTLIAAGSPALPDNATSGNASITFNATGNVGPADHLELVQGDGQTETVNTNVTTLPQVRVVDEFGNAITTGYSVTFTPSGDGSVGASPDTSDASGIADPTSWTLATTAGANTLIAAGSPALPDNATSGNASITFNATGTAAAADHLELVQGDSQSADAGNTVATEPQVRVVDEFGNPVTTGYSVTFTPSGTGAVGTSPDTSDGSGIAGPTTWTLSQTAGANTLIAAGSPALPDNATSGNASITFNATGNVGPADHLELVQGDGQTETVNTNVTTVPQVRVVDEFGNVVTTGYSITFTPSGDGSVGSSPDTSDGSGIADPTSWTLATTAGANTLIAAGSPALPDNATSGNASITFNATGTAAAADHLELVQGDSQSATVNTNVATEPQVRVVDEFGNPVTTGYSITFTPSGTGAVGASPDTSDGSGIAGPTTWTLSQTAGANTLVAAGSPALPDNAASGNASITFNATGTAAAADHLELVQGDSQSANAGNNVATEPQVRVVDEFGNPVTTGYSVTFTPSGTGAVGASPDTSDGSGIAGPTTWTLSQTAGANTLIAAGSPALPDNATSGNASITFNATGNVGPADHLELVQGDSQSATVNTNVATEPQVRVVDEFGNAVTSGYSITFTPSGTGAVGASPDTSDGSGIAGPTTWTLSQTSGANTLIAAGSPALPDNASSGNASITFNATGNVGAADHLELVQGDGQSAAAGNDVATEPQVRVVDEFGNPVTTGYSITFTPSGTGAVGASPDTSDGSGIAGPTTWTLSQTAGANTLVAAGSPALPDNAASGNASITFNATGNVGAADHLELVQGDSQSANAGNNVATEPQVRVVDEFGNVVTTGYSITFTPSGTGAVGASPDTSDGSGIAGPTTWTLSQTAGANTLIAAGSPVLPDNASSGNASITFNATGNVGPADHLELVQGDSQTATVNTNVATEPQVRVVDEFGNTVTSGYSITFTPSGTGAVGASPDTSDGSGIAGPTTWTLSQTSGANTLIAAGSPALPDNASSGNASITFNATGNPGAADHLVLVQGDSQSAAAGTTVGTEPQVRVVDEFNNTVTTGYSITFTPSGTGAVGASPDTSDGSGIAGPTTWTLSQTAGANTLIAAGSPALPDNASSGNASITFNATGNVGAADHLELVQGDSQSATVNTNVSTEPQVRVVDQFGNPVTTGYSVTFTPSGTGAVGASPDTSDGSGIAGPTTWTLSQTSGANTLIAAGSPALPDNASSGNASITFNATGNVGAADHLELVQGDGQSATVATAVSTVPQVRVVDEFGNTVTSGYSVTFTPSGTGSVGSSPDTSDGSGIADPTSWTLSQTSGANTLIAAGSPALPDNASSGNASITFNATGNPGAADHLVLVQGDSQSAAAGTTVGTEPQVRVVDEFNNTITTGHSITFTPSGTGAVGASPDTSDGSGIAGPTTWTLSQTAGANTLIAAGSPALPDNASSGNASITFNATGTVGAADHLELVQGDGQSATVNSNVATEPQVRVVDQFGNPVTTGYSVTFTPSGTGAVGASPDTSDGSGIAGPTTWTLSQTSGANTLIAAGSPALPDNASSGNASITFNATGNVGAADHLELVQGDGQSATVNTNVATEPQVRVVDEFGNTVTSGYSITFTPSGTGAVGSSPDTSDGSGIAGPTTWTLSQTSGANTLIAAGSPGLPDNASSGNASITFNATGNPGAADHLVLVQGDGQSAVAGNNVPVEPQVRVVDEFGNTFTTGYSITFTPSGDGAVGASPDTSDGSGIAGPTTWTLESTPGGNTLIAAGSPGLPDNASSGNASITFNATATVMMLLPAIPIELCEREDWQTTRREYFVEYDSKSISIRESQIGVNRWQFDLNSFGLLLSEHGAISKVLAVDDRLIVLQTSEDASNDRRISILNLADGTALGVDGSGTQVWEGGFEAEATNNWQSKDSLASIRASEISSIFVRQMYDTTVILLGNDRGAEVLQVRDGRIRFDQVDIGAGIKNIHLTSRNRVYYERFNRGLERADQLSTFLQSSSDGVERVELNRYIASVGPEISNAESMLVQEGQQNKVLLKFGDRYIEVEDGLRNSEATEFHEYSIANLPENWLKQIETETLRIQVNESERFVNRECK